MKFYRLNCPLFTPKKLQTSEKLLTTSRSNFSSKVAAFFRRRFHLVTSFGGHPTFNKEFPSNKYILKNAPMGLHDNQGYQRRVCYLPSCNPCWLCFFFLLMMVSGAARIPTEAELGDTKTCWVNFHTQKKSMFGLSRNQRLNQVKLIDNPVFSLQSNHAPVDMVNILLFTRFYTSQVVQDFFHAQYDTSFTQGKKKRYTELLHQPLF